MSDSIDSVARKLEEGFREVQITLAHSLGALFFPANRDQGHSRLPQGKTCHLTDQEYGCLPDEDSNPTSPRLNIPAEKEFPAIRQRTCC